MFPGKHGLPQRPTWPRVVALVVLAGLGLLLLLHVRRNRRQATEGIVETLEAARESHDAAGRSGDLVIRDSSGARVTVVAAHNVPGHRPLLGAIVDVALEGGDVPDPLIWFRTVEASPADVARDLTLRTPQSYVCANGGSGIRAVGKLGLGVVSQICAAGGGRFTLTTSARSLSEGAMIADELNVGSLPVVVAVDGAAWDTEHDSSFVAFAEGGTAVLLEAPRLHVTRSFSRFAAETFPSPVLVRYGGGDTVTRTLAVVRGDVLDALGLLRGPSRTLEVTFGEGRGGTVSIRDDGDRELARGELARGQARRLRIPGGFGTHAVLRDDEGVVTDERVALPPEGATARAVASPAPRGTLDLAYTDAAGAPLPVHVLLRGLESTKDPLPLAGGERVVPAGRSVYALDGRAKVALAPGKYRVTASHGTAYSLSVREVAVAPGATVQVVDSLRAAVDTSGWFSADFHLHSAPSPDSSVSLEARVTSLACEGVDLAVATDHNHVTDLGPAAHALGADARLGTIPGVEITSVTEKWGHFNAFPMPLPKRSPEEGVPVYYGRTPAEMFASARTFGAKVVQVNHARMASQIGYFDLAHVDGKTGRADPVFSQDFDVFEAFNGMWLETPEKVREGPLDVVALARRGKKVTVTGNSDSHHLLYEEAGYPRTWVHAPRDPVATLAERAVPALLSGDTTVSSGPFVEMTVEGQGIGRTVRPGAAGSVHVRVRVSAPAWVPVERVQIYRDDVVHATYPVTAEPRDGVRFETELDVPTDGKDRVVFAWADAERPLPDVGPYEHARAIGFTGPVYVDADGDGGVRVPPGSLAGSK